MSKTYSDSFKRQVVKLMQSGEFENAEIAKRYSIPTGTVACWVGRCDPRFVPHPKREAVVRSLVDWDKMRFTVPFKQVCRESGLKDICVRWLRWKWGVKDYIKPRVAKESKPLHYNYGRPLNWPRPNGREIDAMRRRT